MKPLIIRRVVGHSMEPTLHEGQLVMASGLLPVRSGDVVVAKIGDLELIKRLAVLPDNQRILAGDNKTDNHDLAWNDETHIIGKVFWPVIF